MAHPNLDEMIARMRAAREAGSVNEASPEQLQRLRELARDCPAFTPNLLELARLLRLTDEPEVEMEQALEEIQRLLEQAVQASGRSAPALLELAHFTPPERGLTTAPRVRRTPASSAPLRGVPWAVPRQ